MNNSSKLTFFACALPMLFSAAIFAKGGMNNPMPSKPGPQQCAGPAMMFNYFEQLNLTQAQKAKLFDINAHQFMHRGPQFEKGKKPGKSRHQHNYNQQMQHMLFSQHFDEKKVRQFANKMEKQHRQAEQHFRQQRFVEHAKFIHQQLEVLTAEQRTKLDTLIKKSPCNFGQPAMPMPPMPPAPMKN
ncbi:MAG: hypothetical protein CENE_01422 [Candidatus Celerinatantimonas neptuna]|nr:MAG: hypothetical protein CENE_01422 [Candidatus Celerinatantimonas neptuna]